MTLWLLPFKLAANETMNLTSISLILIILILNTPYPSPMVVNVIETHISSSLDVAATAPVAQKLWDYNYWHIYH